MWEAWVVHQAALIWCDSNSKLCLIQWAAAEILVSAFSLLLSTGFFGVFTMHAQFRSQPKWEYICSILIPFLFYFLKSTSPNPQLSISHSFNPAQWPLIPQASKFGLLLCFSHSHYFLPQGISHINGDLAQLCSLLWKVKSSLHFCYFCSLSIVSLNSCFYLFVLVFSSL